MTRPSRSNLALGSEAREILATLPVPVLRSDSHGKVVFANFAAKEFFGDDVIGKSVGCLYGSNNDLPFSNPSVVKEELAKSPDARLINVRIPVHRKDGSLRETLCSFRFHEDSETVDAVIFEGAAELQRALLRISESLIRPGQLQDTLSVITTEARRLSKAERAYLKIYEPSRDVLVFKALSSIDPSETLPESFSSTTRGMTGYAFSERRAYRSGNVFKEPVNLYYSIFKTTISKVVVPLLYSFSEEREGVSLFCYGVLSVDGVMENQFGPDVEDILKALASHAAVAIAQANLIHETRSTYDELIRGIRSTQDTTFAANILHDGKNMIRGVIHEVETIMEELADKPFMRRRQNILDNRIDKLRDLLDTVGGLVRTLRSPRSGESEVVELESLARKVARIVPTADSDIQIKVEAEFIPFSVYGHQTQLLLMLYNLVVNAVNAMRRASISGIIQILLTNTPGRPGFKRIQVIDEGPGLSKLVLSLLRGAEQYSTTPGGLGVGLLTVREAIKDLNGSLAVDSRLGSGATFTIDLPGA